MSRLSEVQPGPKDLLLDDLSDELLDDIEQQASALGLSFSTQFPNLFAACIDVSPYRLAGATALQIDPE